MQRNGEFAVSYVIKRNKGQCRTVIIVKKINGLTVDPMTPVVQWTVLVRDDSVITRKVVYITSVTGSGVIVI